MKILVIGSGGREHALVWKLRQSPRVEKIYCAPGNGGIARGSRMSAGGCEECRVAVGAGASRPRQDLTVIGPELPLAVWAWWMNSPKRAARLRADESGGAAGIQQDFCQGIHEAPPHSDGALAICNSMNEVLDALPHFHPPLVVKADGLAAGKGVVICKRKKKPPRWRATCSAGKCWARRDGAWCWKNSARR